MHDDSLFRTERLLVRRLGERDIDSLFAVYSDAEAMRWVDDGQPIEHSACVEWVSITQRNYSTRGYGMSAILKASTGEVVGFCGIVHPGNQSEPEIKYALLREHWGRGLATEAARGMLDYARAQLGLVRVIATVAPENVASQRVLRKAGMSYLETRIEEDGERVDVFVWVAQPDSRG